MAIGGDDMTNDQKFAVPCPAGTCENLTTAIRRECEEVVDVYCEHCNVTVTHDARWYYIRRVEQADEARGRFDVRW